MKIASQAARALGLLSRPVRDNASFFVFMYALGWACIHLTTPGDHDPEYCSASAMELFADLYAVCIILCLIPRRVRRVVRGVLSVALYAVSLADVFCYARFGSVLNPTLLLLAEETNAGEAGEFFSAYLGWDVIASPVGWLLLIMLLHALSCFLPRLLRRIRRQPRACIRLRRTCACLCRRLSGVVAPLSGAVLAALFVACAVSSMHNKRLIRRIMSYDTIGQVERGQLGSDKPHFYLPVHRLVFSIYANRLAARQIDILTENIGRVRVDSCSFRSPEIVLIIGESYNRHHSELYGYDHPMTPRQKARAANGSLTVFDDVVAPWNLTSFVFKHMLSMYTVGDKGDWCDYPLFPELFRKAGYGVTFASNQFLFGAGDALYDFSGGFFLNDEKLSHALFDARNKSQHEFDEDLIGEYDTMPKPAAKANLTIIHLWGQHAEYRKRYPRKHKKYHYQDYDRPKLNKHSKMVLADYDNATLYNDSVVDAVMRRFEDREAVVVYLSDHGESCFGFDRNYFGRTHSDNITYETAYEEYEIPFWVWCSPAYRAAHPDVVAALRAARRKPFMTDRLGHMLVWLAGISCPYYRADCNPLSDSYDAARPRLLKHAVDYDKLREEYGK